MCVEIENKFQPFRLRVGFAFDFQFHFTLNCGLIFYIWTCSQVTSRFFFLFFIAPASHYLPSLGKRLFSERVTLYNAEIH